MKVRQITVVDGLRRVSADEAFEFEGQTREGATNDYVRVDLRLKERTPGTSVDALMVESLGGIDLILKREDAKNVFIGQLLHITISDEG